LAQSINVSVLKIANAAMNHFQVIGTGCPAKIAAIDQCHGEPALGGIPRSTRAKDSATNYDEIEFGICQT
jgi:hypothetical protein